MLAVRCSMCILHFFVFVFVICNVTAILTVINKRVHTYIHDFVVTESPDLPNSHTKFRKRMSNEKEWVRNKRRKLRNAGHEYVSSRGKVMAGKKFPGLPSFCCKKIVAKGCLMRIVRHCLCSFGPVPITTCRVALLLGVCHTEK